MPGNYNVGMTENREIEEFRKKSILIICWAGSDRSQLIADELNRRGYFAEGRGVMGGQNYVTENDLSNVGTIVFASQAEKNKFDRNHKLRKLALGRGIDFRVLNITESDKDRSFSSPDRKDFLKKIEENLDGCGLIDLNTRH